jgi:hypothetical protein
MKYVTTVPLVTTKIAISLDIMIVQSGETGRKEARLSQKFKNND